MSRAGDMIDIGTLVVDLLEQTSAFGGDLRISDMGERQPEMRYVLTLNLLTSTGRAEPITVVNDYLIEGLNLLLEEART